MTITFGSSIKSNSLSAVNANSTVESVASSNESSCLFECPEEGCVRSFIKYGNLLRHLTVGDHRKMSEKTNLLDTVKKLYHSKLSNAENKKII